MEKLDITGNLGRFLPLIDSLEEYLNPISDLWLSGSLMKSDPMIRAIPGQFDFNPILSFAELRRIQQVSGERYKPEFGNLFDLQIPSHDLIERITQIFPSARQSLSGYFEYPPGGYMSWHTNGNDVGVRLYLGFSRSSDGSFFRYQDPWTKEVVTDYDVPGWKARLFFPSKELPFWHCVGAYEARLSIGINLGLLQNS